MYTTNILQGTGRLLIKEYPTQNVHVIAAVKLRPICRPGIMPLSVFYFLCMFCVFPQLVLKISLSLVVLSKIIEKLIVTASFKVFNSVKLSYILIECMRKWQRNKEHCSTAPNQELPPSVETVVLSNDTLRNMGSKHSNKSKTVGS